MVAPSGAVKTKRRESGNGNASCNYNTVLLAGIANGRAGRPSPKCVLCMRIVMEAACVFHRGFVHTQLITNSPSNPLGECSILISY